jgi:hypothetical protein
MAYVATKTSVGAISSPGVAIVRITEWGIDWLAGLFGLDYETSLEQQQE